MERTVWHLVLLLLGLPPVHTSGTSGTEITLGQSGARYFGTECHFELYTVVSPKVLTPAATLISLLQASSLLTKPAH